MTAAVVGLSRALRLDGAMDWVDRAVAGFGRARIAEPERVRDRPWSTQLRVPTTAGTAWFKAGCPALAFEPALHAVLADLRPDDVDAPLAIDHDRGWLLTADRGRTLRETRSPTDQDWQQIAVTWARIQHAATGAPERVLATGIPNHGPQRLADDFDLALTELAAHPRGHPARPGEDEQAALAARRPQIVEAARTLSDSPFPLTVQHGDLHAGNVFATPEGLRIFDFGDAQWTEASEVLLIPLAILEHEGAVGRVWPALVDAYTGTWRTLGVAVHAADVERMLAAVEIAQAVHRTQTWIGALAQADASELAEWGEAPRRHLRRVLSAEPVRCPGAASSPGAPGPRPGSPR